MDRHHLIRLLAVGRIAVGSGLVLAPRLFGGTWFGAAATQPATQVAIRALGIRDLVLGVGTYRALDQGTDVATWVSLGVACDAVDAVATAAGARDLPRLGALATIAVASSATAIGVSALRSVED